MGRAYSASSRENRAAVDVAAGDRHADAQARGVDPPGQQRRERAGAARLRDGLQRARTGTASRRRSRRRTRSTTSSTQPRMTGNVSSPGIGSCWPSAIVRGTWIRTRSPAAQRAARVVARLGLDADDAHVRRERGDRGRAAGDQPAAADADQQHVERAGRPRAAPAPPCPGRPSRAGRRRGGPGRARARRPARRAAPRDRRRSGRSARSRRRSRAWRRACPAARRRASGSRPGRRAAARPARAPARGCPRRRSRRRAARSSAVSDGDGVVGAAELERADALQVLGLQEHPCAPVASSSARDGQHRRAVRDALDAAARRRWTSSSAITAALQQQRGSIADRPPSRSRLAQAVARERGGRPRPPRRAAGRR